MTTFLRAALLFGGIFYLAIGTGFLIAPERLGEAFGVAPAGTQGLSSMRADFTAFFWVVGGSMAMGAVHDRGSVLWPAAALIGIALSGRVFSLVSDGSYPAAFQPMVVEALTLALALAGTRLLGKGATA